jgi:hypothetical protein
VQITRFVGELIVVRLSWAASENVLAFLLDVVDAQVKWSRKHDRPLARIALVLEGWAKATIEGRVGHHVTWAVHPLRPEPAPAHFDLTDASNQVCIRSCKRHVESG